MSKKPNPARGRPKTFDRDRVLQTALTQYWVKGASKCLDQ